MVKRLVISFIASILLVWASSCTFAFPVIFPCTYILFGGWHVLWRIKQTLVRDLGIVGVFKDVINVRKLIKKNNITYHKQWQSLVDKHPNKVVIYFQDEKWTYIQIVSSANKVANYLACNSNLEVGDSVALIAENCPEFLVLLLALSKLGCPAALINYNLRGKQLIHTIQIASCKAVIVVSSLSDNVKAVEGELSSDIMYYSFCRGESDTCYKDVIQLSKDSPETAPTNRDSKITVVSTLCYIYTSGTTGLPKPCIVTHLKSSLVGIVFAKIIPLVESDTVYITLPLYHTSGLLIAAGSMLTGGCSMYLKRKFSTSEFWDDCEAHKCTVIFYIGELCRYLLLQPDKPSERDHKVRVAVGNGLRGALWKKFSYRFQIPRILEFYGSTEGYSTLLNLISEPGYIGYLLVSLKDIPIFRTFYNLNFLARLNPETGEILRSPDGLCVRCDVNEPGEILGVVQKGEKIIAYLSEEQTMKNIVRDVVTRGDIYSRTGDVVSANELGLITFLDRKGDTFRWKGENVSTTEVESIITSILGLNDVVVYSVAIPGIEGRAGMVAIVKRDVDLDGLLENMKRSLPSYCVPMFIRLTAAADLTGTFKYTKVNLKKDGFDINIMSDPIFFLDPRCKKYVPLDSEVFSLLMESKLRV